jgi:hypothetical protein
MPGYDPDKPSGLLTMDRIRRSIRLEDVLLFGWVAVAEPLLTVGSRTDGGGQATDPVLGVLRLLALVAAGAAILTRTAGEPIDREEDPVPATIGPLIGGFAMVGFFAFEALAADSPEWISGVAVLVPLVAVFARNRLPEVPIQTRRLLVTPYVMAAGGVFDDLVGNVGDLFDLRLLGGLGAASDGERTFGIFLVLIGVAFAAVFYAMLVVAPRRFILREGSPGTWLVRFGVFLAGLAIGSTVAAAG